MTLNVEEMILLQQTEHSTRNAALRELAVNRRLTQDAELLGLYRQLISKLRAMSEQEFAAIDLTVYDAAADAYDAEVNAYGGENNVYDSEIEIDEGNADEK